MPESAAPDPALAPQLVCAADALAERGAGVLFDVQYYGQSLRAFALRIDGRPVAYLNRCAHVPVELDWQPGQFLDDEGEVILCTVHGAAYEPASGRCLGGPCGRGRLVPLDVREADGRVHWYPSRDIRPPSMAAAAADASPVAPASGGTDPATDPEPGSPG